MAEHDRLVREIVAGLALPGAAFGAAVEIEGLLDEPELHYAAGPLLSRLVLMPRLGTFSRLVLEWEILPEIGLFTASSWPVGALGDADIARLETWMRDVASICHGFRGVVRESAERVVRDAADGLDESLPPTDDPLGQGRASHVVTARVGTRVARPLPGTRHGIVDVTSAAGRVSDPEGHAHPDHQYFVDRMSGQTLGRRLTLRDGDEIVDTRLEPLAADVTQADLAGWYDQHIVREVLFDDVWQVHVHLLAGLDAPASVAYFG